MFNYSWLYLLGMLSEKVALLFLLAVTRGNMNNFSGERVQAWLL